MVEQLAAHPAAQPQAGGEPLALLGEQRQAAQDDQPQHGDSQRQQRGERRLLDQQRPHEAGQQQQLGQGGQGGQHAGGHRQGEAAPLEGGMGR